MFVHAHSVSLRIFALSRVKRMPVGDLLNMFLVVVCLETATTLLLYVVRLDEKSFED